MTTEEFAGHLLAALHGPRGKEIATEIALKSGLLEAVAQSAGHAAADTTSLSLLVLADRRSPPTESPRERFRRAQLTESMAAVIAKRVESQLETRPDVSSAHAEILKLAGIQ